MGDEKQDSQIRQPNPGPQWKAILAVIGGIVVHLSLGASFILGNFIPYIASYMRCHGEPNIRQTDLVWVVAVNSIGFGCCMFMAGPIERKIGSRLCILLSSFLMSFSILISGYTVKKDLVSFAITDGFMTGAAISIGYPTTLRVAMKWMPSWKSTVSGVVLAGHGASSVIFTQVVTAYINPENFRPNLTIHGEKYFDEPSLLARVPWSFIMLGCTFVVLQIIGTAMISPPPNDEKEEETDVTSENQNGRIKGMGIQTVRVRTLEEANKDREIQRTEKKTFATRTEVHSIGPKQMLKRKQFYILWGICILNGQSILFISGLYKAFGQNFISDDHFLAVVGSVSAVGNTLGRAMWGVFADKLGEKISFIAIAVIVTALQCLINLSESVGKYYFLFIVFFMFLTGTGTYAVLSSATYKCFGPKHYSTNFGLIFTSQAVAGILNSTLTTGLQAKVGWHGMFYISAGLTGVSVILSFLYTERVPVAPIASPNDEEVNGHAGSR